MKVGSKGLDLNSIADSMRANQDSMARVGQDSKSNETSSFAEMLKGGLKQVNDSMQGADKASMDLVSGKNSNIHETMLAASKAELGFNLLVQLRNKAIEAYQDISRMQV